MKNKCWLFVPAREKTLSKVIPNKGYAIIIDLEDSISENEKDVALQYASEYVEKHVEYSSDIIIRVNRDRLKTELQALKKWPIQYMIPKYEGEVELSLYENLFNGHKIIALIETPMGVLNIEQIAASGKVQAIAFGAEDFTASINMDNTNELLISTKMRVLTAAKAFSIPVVDTPSFHVNDEEKFKEDLSYSLRLGFDGKMAIHPKHVDYINKCFSHGDVLYYESIVNEYDRLGGGVQMIDGKVYEKMHINRLRKIIKENIV